MHAEFDTQIVNPTCVQTRFNDDDAGAFLVDQPKRSGWQHQAGDHGARDLKLFDTVLALLRKNHKIDDRRIYVTGHSNGGRFTYLLWATRGNELAAVAPSGSPATKLFQDLKPKPCLHAAGEKDALVKFEWQSATMEAIRKINGCDAEGRREGKTMVYASRHDAPFASYIYPGGHAMPADAPDVIVAFFKQHVRREPKR